MPMCALGCPKLPPPQSLKVLCGGGNFTVFYPKTVLLRNVCAYGRSVNWQGRGVHKAYAVYEVGNG